MSLPVARSLTCCITGSGRAHGRSQSLRATQCRACRSQPRQDSCRLTPWEPRSQSRVSRYRLQPERLRNGSAPDLSWPKDRLQGAGKAPSRAAREHGSKSFAPKFWRMGLATLNADLNADGVISHCTQRRRLGPARAAAAAACRFTRTRRRHSSSEGRRARSRFRWIIGSSYCKPGPTPPDSQRDLI